MTERFNVIRFPIERRGLSPAAIAARNRNLRISLLVHTEMVAHLRRELRFEQTREEKLAHLAIKVCDSVLASRDTEGDEHTRLVDESADALREYEQMKQPNERGE